MDGVLFFLLCSNQRGTPFCNRQEQVIYALARKGGGKMQRRVPFCAHSTAFFQVETESSGHIRLVASNTNHNTRFGIRLKVLRATP